MFSWTDTPLQQIWHDLRYLRSPANVYNLLIGKTSCGRAGPWPETDRTKQSAYEVAACIRQADEYYQAADRVSLVTHPLLQFYGVHALAKAVVLANDQTMCLNGLRYHGLSTRSGDDLVLRNYVNDPSSWRLEQEFATTNSGVFEELCRNVGDTAPHAGSVLAFKELIRMVPDLAEVYSRHYAEPSHCFYVSDS